MKRLTHTKLIVLTSLLINLTAIVNASAGGFAILEQSAEGVGYGFAGAAAGYGDGSSIVFNPAALIKLEGTQVTLGAHGIITSADFSNKGSSIAPALGGSPLRGSEDNGGSGAIVPHLYITHRLNECRAFGLGINAPFGLATEYD